MNSQENEFENYKNIPDLIEPSIQMSEPNSTINIFKGEFILRNGDCDITMSGGIDYDWYPSTGSHFYGKPIITSAALAKIINNENSFDVVIDGLLFAKGLIIETTFGGEGPNSIKGIINKEAVLGDKTIPVNKISFSIPNFMDFIGKPVKRVHYENITLLTNRFTFENDNYIITIDKVFDYKERRESLKKKGGYLILLGGELVCKKGSVSFSETKEIFACFDTFLTFLNGRKTSALFIKGMSENQCVWSDFSDYYVDSYKYVRSWPKQNSKHDFDQLWCNFNKLWKHEDNKDFLTSLIHWYVEANGNSVFSEGSIIMAQTALELVYNWWIIEQKRMIIGKDTENINASNKIRLLLSQLNLSQEMPDRIPNLIDFMNKTENIPDIPEAIVYIRNAIVHSQVEKRKKLSAIHGLAIFEALQVYLWYIELSLLRILDYKGEYSNRCTNIYKKKEFVPWIV